MQKEHRSQSLKEPKDMRREGPNLSTYIRTNIAFHGAESRPGTINGRVYESLAIDSALP